MGVGGGGGVREGSCSPLPRRPAPNAAGPRKSRRLSCSLCPAAHAQQQIQEVCTSDTKQCARELTALLPPALSPRCFWLPPLLLLLPPPVDLLLLLHFVSLPLLDSPSRSVSPSVLSTFISALVALSLSFFFFSLTSRPPATLPAPIGRPARGEHSATCWSFWDCAAAKKRGGNELISFSCGGSGGGAGRTRLTGRQ